MLKKDILVTFGGQVGRLVFATAAGSLLARGLGPSDRGLYALAIWMPTTLSMFAAFGQVEVNSIFAGLHNNKRRELFLQTLLCSVIFGGLGILILFSFFFWIPIPLGEFGKIPQELVILGALLIPILSLDNMLRELARGAERIHSTVLITTLGFAIMAVAILIFIFIFKFGVVTAIWILWAVRILTGSGYIWFIRDFVTLDITKLSFSFMKECLRFGFVFMMSTGAMFLVTCVATFVLGYMEISKTDIGLFAVAVMFSQQMGMIPTSIAQAFLPRLSNNPEDRLDQTPFVFRFTLIACFLSMIGLLIFGCPLVLVLVGWKYWGSIPIILVMLPGLAVFGGARVLGIHLWVLKKPMYGMINNWVTLFATIGLCLLLVPSIGILGAGLANSLALCLLTALTIWAYCRESRISMHELIPRKDDYQLICGEVRRILKRFALKT